MPYDLPRQVIEQLTNGCQVLLDRGLGQTGAELLNVGSHGPWPDSLQLQASLLVPVEELPDGNSIGHPGVPIADVRGEELDEALAGPGAGRHDRDRQRLEPVADQRRRRCDGAVIGQKYELPGFLGHGIRCLLTLAFLLS
jgi:hypothetical protein